MGDSHEDGVHAATAPMLQRHAMRQHLRVIVILAMAAGLGVGLATCKQSEGDRCQVDTDCLEGLVCNQVTKTCQTSSGGGPDGSIRPDASGPDGRPPDARPVDARPVDARRPDANVDAAIN